jgi:hypothetical protein
MYGKVGKDIRFDRLEEAIEKLRMKQITDDHKLASEIESMQLKASNEYFRIEQKLARVASFEKQMIEFMA